METAKMGRNKQLFRSLFFVFMIGCFLATTVLQPVNATDWPMYRNDLANTGHADMWGSNHANLIWNYTTGDQIVSSPAAVGGKIYVGSFDNSTYCLNALDGALIWNYITGDRIFSSPAVVEGKIYFGSTDHKIYCLNALDGSLIWNYTTEGFVYSSPTVVDGKVYVGSLDKRIYCLGPIVIEDTDIARFEIDHIIFGTFLLLCIAVLLICIRLYLTRNGTFSDKSS
jgi:outer membrane protein assembly factor BamB